MADINIKKTSFLSYVMSIQDTSDTVFPYDTSFCTFQYRNYEGGDLKPKPVASYVGNLVHGLFSFNYGTLSSIIPERVTYSVGGLSTSDENKFYNRMHQLGEYFEQYPVLTGYRYNGQNYYSNVVLNMVNGTSGNYPKVTQINFSGDNIYKRDVQLNGQKTWDDTSSATSWTSVYWSNYNSSDQSAYATKSKTAYDMAYALTYTQGNYASIAGWENLMSLTAETTTHDELAMALNATNRFGKSYGTDIPAIHDLFELCSTKSFKLKERVLQGEVQVFKLSNTRYVLSGLSQLVVNGTDDNPMGVLVAYNVNVMFSSNYKELSIPAAAPPVTHNLYNI